MIATRRRASASPPSLLDNTLYDAFGQRPVSVMYTALNQYQVIMEARAAVLGNAGGPQGHLRQIIQRRRGAAERAGPVTPVTTAPLSINHQGQFPCVTLSFNLAPGKALGDAVTAINAAADKIGAAPRTIHGTFQGTAAVFQQSLASEPMLFTVAILAVYNRARHSLRELHPSAHHPVHASLRGARRAPSR